MGDPGCLSIFGRKAVQHRLLAEHVTAEDAQKMAKKLKKGSFDLDDLRNQLIQMKKMGGAQAMLGMMPGIKQSDLKNVNVDERQFLRMEALISSMTEKERRDPSILSMSRKKRVAAGAGQKVEDVNRLLKQFEMLRSVSKQLSKGGQPNLAALQKGRRPHGKKFSGQGGKFKLPF